jgi:beta-lactamase superfamily II metal-dependent hydrolase
LRADVVISGVPAQSEPVSSALLEATQPAVIIITDALYPATARASRRLRERLAEQSARVIYTSESGAVTLVMREGRWRIEDAAGRNLFQGPPIPRSAR